MISVRNLVKAFGKTRAVDEITFDVANGERFAFLGPNGAGKTTTIKMLTTLLTPTSGSILINGVDVLRDPHEARRKLGIVFQDPSLDTELTAQENMSLYGALYDVPRATCRRRTEHLLKLFELWERRKSITRTFSGGMKRRLEIARALLHAPQVLFLDEPTLGLDPQSRNLLWSSVTALNESERLTVFLTTHYMDEAERNAERVAVIDRGVIVAQGTPTEIMAHTRTSSLESAFLQVTGARTRNELAGNTEMMLDAAHAWQDRTEQSQ